MKKIWWLLLVVGVLAIAAGVYVWNKPPVTVEHVSSTKINTEDLFQAFITNEGAANKQYLNKAIELTGTISEVSHNQEGKTVVLLAVSDPLSGVQCTLRDSTSGLVVGQTITVKGFCSGYTLVVLLSDGIVL